MLTCLQFCFVFLSSVISVRLNTSVAIVDTSQNLSSVIDKRNHTHKERKSTANHQRLEAVGLYSRLVRVLSSMTEVIQQLLINFSFLLRCAIVLLDKDGDQL
jgi:hypothetical protein